MVSRWLIARDGCYFDGLAGWQTDPSKVQPHWTFGTSQDALACAIGYKLAGAHAALMMLPVYQCEVSL